MMVRSLILALVVLQPMLAIAGDAVVARVNGSSITQKQLETAIDNLIPRAVYHGTVGQEKRAEFREQALEELILEELQYQDAVAMKLKPDSSSVKEELSRIKDRFGSTKEYKMALERAEMSEKELRARIERENMVRQAKDRVVTLPAKVGDEELKKHYDRNIEKFKRPESLRVRILSTAEEGKAKEALARINAGEDFGNVAARMSEDNYRIKGGDIGYIHRGRIYPELEAAAFQLKPGGVAGPIPAEKKWFLVKVDERLPEAQLSFEESKDKLRKELELKRSKELREQWTARLKAGAKIEIISGTPTPK